MYCQMGRNTEAKQTSKTSKPLLYLVKRTNQIQVILTEDLSSDFLL